MKSVFKTRPTENRGRPARRFYCPVIYLIVLIVSVLLVNLALKFRADVREVDMRMPQDRVGELKEDRAEMLKHFNVDLSKDPGDKENLSVEEHVWYVLSDEYNFTFQERIQAMSILYCESLREGEPGYAIGVNANGSLDLGVWQVNEPSHGGKEGYSRACMFDIYCQTRFVVEQIYVPQGRSWKAWTCW